MIHPSFRKQDLGLKKRALARKTAMKRAMKLKRVKEQVKGKTKMRNRKISRSRSPSPCGILIIVIHADAPGKSCLVKAW